MSKSNLIEALIGMALSFFIGLMLGYFIWGNPIF